MCSMYVHACMRVCVCVCMGVSGSERNGAGGLCREEIGRWAGDVVLLAGEERDTRQRSQRAICAVRYAREASRQTQVRLMRDLIDAVASVIMSPGDEWDAIVSSRYYKMH